MLLTAEGGLLGPIAKLLGYALEWIYEGLGSVGIYNLGICIILFTLFTKLILMPLTVKQQRSAKINAYIQPEIQAIQKKYKNKKDQDSMMRMQQETQAVYKKYGTGMTSGCLGTFIQLPIIMALYRVIYNIPAYVKSVRDLYVPMADQLKNIEGYQTTLATFVTDEKISTATKVATTLSEMDASGVQTNHIIDVIDKFSTSQWGLIEKIFSGNPALLNAIHENVPKITDLNQFFLGINISEKPGWKLSWALLIPITAALFQYLSTKTIQNPQASDPSAATANGMMKGMTITMPIMSFFFCVTLPAGIGIYWSASALFALIMQLAINFYYDHIDMDQLIEKQMAKAAKKNAKGKKSFMEKMLEMGEGAQSPDTASGESYKMAAANLKNYTSSNAQKTENTGITTTKKGSIANKANIMLNYSDNNSKGDK